MLGGFLRSSGRPVQHIGADLWVGSRDLAALGYSHPIPEAWYARLASQPEVERVEPFLYGATTWHRADGGIEQCYLVGSHLNEGAAGVSLDLSAEQRAQLARPGAVALYDPDRQLLGLKKGVGAVGEINGHRVEVVAILTGPVQSAGLLPGLVCSLRTARRLLPNVPSGDASYLVARCRGSGDAEVVARRLTRRATLTWARIRVRRSPHARATTG